MSQSLAKNLIHLVFSTKNRQPDLGDNFRPALHAYMTTVFKNLDCPVIIINSVEDHVHILFLLNRKIALSDMVKDIKSPTSKWLKTQSTSLKLFSWQKGFGAFSVSESQVPVVKKYIATQAEHHKKITFQDELRSLLTKHRIAFDERYLWD